MKEQITTKNIFVRAELCTGCGLCETACSLVKENESAPSKARIFVERLQIDGLMIPHVCHNCKDPSCIKACHRKAIIKDENSGWVSIDAERCNSCMICVGACPYHAIRVTPEHKVVMCDLCDGEPECVKVCSTGAIQYVDIHEGMVVL